MRLGASIRRLGGHGSQPGLRGAAPLVAVVTIVVNWVVRIAILTDIMT
jgi:hypothetical protein